MNKKIGLTAITTIMVVMMLIAFSGVALASRNVQPTPETETLTITTEIVCDKTVIESAELNWESSNKDLLGNPPLASGEKYTAGEKGSLSHAESVDIPSYQKEVACMYLLVAL